MGVFVGGKVISVSFVGKLLGLKVEDGSADYNDARAINCEE